MTEPRSPMQSVEFSEMNDACVSPERLTIEAMKKVRVAVTADLGDASLLVREVLELKTGSIIQLNKMAGEMTDIYVNGVHLARGEVVVIADAIHIRIGEVTGLELDKDAVEDEG